MKQNIYARCTGDKNRMCLLCNSHYLVKNPIETNTFCPDCFTESRKHELTRVKHHLHRAEKAGNDATLTINQWLKILDYFKWKCAYCPNGQFEVLEHIVPILSGGGTTSINCIPACLSCNRRKDSKLLIDKLSKYKIEQVKQQLIDIAL